MILIQTSSNDFSSNAVTQWLSYDFTQFERLNDKSLVEQITINQDNPHFVIKNKTVNLKEIKKFWFRRGSFSLTNNEQFNLNLFNFLQGESLTVIEILNKHFNNKNSLGNFTSSKVNKILNCNIANKYGLKTPSFIVTTSKEDLIEFYNTKNKIISKSLYGLPGFKDDNHYYSCKTKLVTFEDIKKTNDTFFPSLFQEYIEKRIEIRTFFINNKFFSCAIFSQNDEKTSVDFRNYNREKPNRIVPFNLPYELKRKLIKINKKLLLNSGSYDLILTPNEEYFFLEVNPIGQYAQVSIPCNYHLDKKIANFLKNG